MHLFRYPDEAEVKALLAACGLPGDDIEPKHLEHFFGCGPETAPVGVVGVQLFGPVGLLRSLAVGESGRGEGCGTRLVHEVEAHAKSEGVHDLYLLTNAATRFFTSLGYEVVDRRSAPQAIRATTQFSSSCCSGATLMVKHLGG